ncbi:hypothetical protein RchiOBHm_Chr5g0026961 [Rosa chinensis]|uniref:Uncharacterized protein n=1 Tax=Rosa chinensis TaxID=74649 RepID=A0A2P6Q8Z2_ROSCH|nr:hypothetical protein RchiOBHm_Chr5g0026961 [Rosa chinensis]
MVVTHQNIGIWNPLGLFVHSPRNHMGLRTTSIDYGLNYGRRLSIETHVNLCDYNYFTSFAYCELN